MAALPAGALLGTDQKPTGTDAQGGGLQPEKIGGHPGKAQRVENALLKKQAERMKTKNLDECDESKSIFASAACRRHHPFSKTTPFADISFRVDKFVGTTTQGSSATLGWMNIIPLG
jgi:hypothetical protein